MISKTALHAVRAVVALAELPEGEFRGASAIAKKVDAPSNYLGKLLQTLSQEGIVYSQRGMGGGFRLARDPAEITLYDVVETIDHLSRWTGCFLNLRECTPDKPCVMHERWSEVRGALISMLHEVTIAELVQGTKSMSDIV